MEFRRVKLGEVSDITKLAGFEFTKYIEYVEDGEIIALRALNLRKGELDLTDIKKIRKSVSDSLTRSKLCKNDILLTYTGNGYGDCALIAENDRYHLAPNICKITPHTDKVCPYYLYSYIRSSLFYQTMRNNMTGSSQPTIPMKTIRILEIPVPCIDVQKKIGSIIKSIDEKMRMNRKVNENLYQQVVALYGSLFGKSTQQTSTVGRYSEQIYSGGTPATSNPEYWNGEFHWFSSGETRNRFAITTDKTITKAGVDNSSTKLAHKYDIVMASAGQGLTRGQTTMLLLDTYVNQSVIVIHANHTVLPYLFWNLADRYDELRAISDSSSIRGSLTTKMISGFKIPEVDSESLATFSDFAWAVISEIENNLLENERLSTLRDTLLPRLISGELDVSELDL